MLHRHGDGEAEAALPLRRESSPAQGSVAASLSDGLGFGQQHCGGVSTARMGRNGSATVTEFMGPHVGCELSLRPEHTPW